MVKDAITAELFDKKKRIGQAAHNRRLQIVSILWVVHCNYGEPEQNIGYCK